MEAKKTLSETKKILLALCVCFLLAILIFLAGFLFASKKSAPILSSTTILQQFKEVSDLSVIEYQYTDVGKFENSSQINGWTIPLTKKSFILAYSGVVRVGISLEEVEVDVKKDSITFYLPQPEILSHEIDEESIEVYDETKNIFNPISIKDYTQFAAEQKKAKEEEIQNSDLFQSAKDRTEKVISSLINISPDGEELYTILFQYEEK